MDNKYEFVATCLFGLERLLGEEIDALGYERVETIDGRVTFKGPIEAAARANIWLRCAERVLLKIGSFKAYTFDDLFEGTRSLCWEEWILCDDAFPVKGHSVRSKLFSVSDCQSIVKKAIVTRLSGEYGIERFEESASRLQIEFFILNDTVTMMLDTTGVGLHKRGYRTESVLAPISETLAAALVKLSRPREGVLTWDPFCGSGTIAIEAAMIMRNKAPGLNRRFASEDYDSFPRDIWTRAREEARDSEKDTRFEAYASDFSPAAVEITEANIKRAGVETNVKAFVQDALKIEKGGRRGTIVCNPPYGERLSDRRECEELYRKMGRHFASLEPWQIYIITSHRDFARLYGRRPDKVRKLYNGMLECGFYQFFKNRSKG